MYRALKVAHELSNEYMLDLSMVFNCKDANKLIDLDSSTEKYLSIPRQMRNLIECFASNYFIRQSQLDKIDIDELKHFHSVCNSDEYFTYALLQATEKGCESILMRIALLVRMLQSKCTNSTEVVNKLENITLDNLVSRKPNFLTKIKYKLHKAYYPDDIIVDGFDVTMLAIISGKPTADMASNVRDYIREEYKREGIELLW